MIFYIIKKTDEVSAEIWAASLSNENNARKSLDGSKVILKFEASEVPAILAGETIYQKDVDGDFLTDGEW